MANQDQDPAVQSELEAIRQLPTSGLPELVR